MMSRMATSVIAHSSGEDTIVKVGKLASSRECSVKAKCHTMISLTHVAKDGSLLVKH